MIPLKTILVSRKSRYIFFRPEIAIKLQQNLLFVPKNAIDLHLNLLLLP